MRTAAIWVSGLVASGLIGVIVGDAVSRDPSVGFAAMIAGALLFTCLRLWLTEEPKKATMPILDLKGDRLQ